MCLYKQHELHSYRDLLEQRNQTEVPIRPVPGLADRVFHKKTTSSSLIVKQWREAGYNLQLGNQPLRTSTYVRKDVNFVFNSWMAHTAVMTSICADRGQRSCRLSCCEQTGRGRQVCLRLGVKQKLHSKYREGGYS